MLLGLAKAKRHKNIPGVFGEKVVAASTRNIQSSSDSSWSDDICVLCFDVASIGVCLLEYKCHELSKYTAWTPAISVSQGKKQ